MTDRSSPSDETPSTAKADNNEEQEAIPGTWPHSKYDAPAYQPRRGSEASADFRTLFKTYVNRHLPESPERKHVPPQPPSKTSGYARILPLLRLIPWLLAGLFVFSFIWDFQGYTLAAFGYSLSLEGILRVVSVSGMIGFLTNWLAVTMLFQPREARPIFGQGLIPAQRERVIYRLAQAVSKELLNEAIIKEKIEESQIIPKYRERFVQLSKDVIDDPEFRHDLKVLTSRHVQEAMGADSVQQRIVDFTIKRLEYHAKDGLSGLALKAYRFLNEEEFRRRIDEAVQELPESVDLVLDELDYVLDRLPSVLEERSDEIEDAATRAILRFVERLDVYDMVATNMERFDDRQLENLLKKTSNEQLNYIKYLGGVLGFFGGLVIWNAPLALSVFAIVGITLYLLDEFLFRRQTAT